mmetsp:Transcript_701/g.2092  ORF Transcript_701/g.2092 Transcript_701/m.2092 type:complete len:200 (-) Transcript_701:299-898(-)
MPPEVWKVQYVPRALHTAQGGSALPRRRLRPPRRDPFSHGHGAVLGVCWRPEPPPLLTVDERVDCCLVVVGGGAGARSTDCELDGVLIGPVRTSGGCDEGGKVGLQRRAQGRGRQRLEEVETAGVARRDLRHESRQGRSARLLPIVIRICAHAHAHLAVPQRELRHRKKRPQLTPVRGASVADEDGALRGVEVRRKSSG